MWGFLATFAVLASPASLHAKSPPNVLFILADDLGVMDIGIETPDEDFYETPNIDKIAKQSMRFNQAYAAAPVCTPSRASIMLGVVPARHGMTDYIGAKIGSEAAEENQRALMPPDYVRALPSGPISMPEAFRAAGYVTFFAGKWHLGSKGSWPEDHGFDINIGGWDLGAPAGGYFAPWKNPNLSHGHDGESLTHRLARETAAFIKSNNDKPFFAFLSFYAVHAPAQTSRERWSKFRDKAAAMDPPAERFAIDRTLPVRLVRDNPVHAGLIETLDECVGIVLEALESAGIADNTIICFTSDNGGIVSGDGFPSSMLPLRGGKGRQWEGGLRVPAYIYAPGVTRFASETDTPLIGTDFFPTLLELTGQPLMPEQHIDGISLVPALKGESTGERPLFWHYPHYGNQGGGPSSIIRRGDWKLIHYWEDQHRELYNLAEDPGELNDVFSQYPKIADRLGTELESHLKSVGAKLPEAWPGYRNEMLEAKRKRAIQLKQRLEKNHADYLDPAWRPNETWWDSTLGKD